MILELSELNVNPTELRDTLVNNQGAMRKQDDQVMWGKSLAQHLQQVGGPGTVKAVAITISTVSDYQELALYRWERTHPN